MKRPGFGWMFDIMLASARYKKEKLLDYYDTRIFINCDSDSFLLSRHYEVKPTLISLQVRLLLGHVQCTIGCKYVGLQETMAHSKGLMIGRRTASPKEKKYMVVFLCHYVCTDKSLNLCPQIKIAPVAGDAYMRAAVIPAQIGKGLCHTSIWYYSKK